MCFGLFKDSGCDFKRSELLYCFIQNLAGVIIYLISGGLYDDVSALTMVRGWTLSILEVKGQGHNGHIWKLELNL